MSVGTLCNRNVDVITQDESAQVAAGRLHSHKVGCLVVVDAAQEPIGILTDRDLAVRVVAEGREPAQTRVREVMTRNPRTVLETSEIEDALRIMRTGSFRRVPVVDRTDRLVGLLSLDDVLRLFSDDFAQIGTLIDQAGPGSLVTA